VVKSFEDELDMANLGAPEEDGLGAVSPLTDNDLELPAETFQLGENIYSALMVVPFIPAVMDKWKHRLFIAEYYSLIFANALVQGVITIYIRLIYQDAAEENGRCGSKENSKPLRWVCIMCYVGYVIGDLNETWNMVLWLYNQAGGPFPCVDWCVDSVTGMMAPPADVPVQERQQSMFEAKFTIVDADGDERNKYTLKISDNIKNMNCLNKLFMYFGVLGYKFGIAAALIGYGSGYIIASEQDSDIILNALALCFVLDIDEMIYCFFCSKEIQNVVEEKAPRVQKTVPLEGKECWRVSMIPFKVFFLVGITWAENIFYCSEDDE